MAGENDTFLLTRPDFEMTSDSAAVMYSLIGSCKNLTESSRKRGYATVISVINTWPANRMKELLPWNVTLSVN
ncbi:truncated transposase [Escherichia coli]|uniref:Truncated transposase n=1 Tax=Escherichia coli TaxID=562 RepID=A0A376LB42_ECOLX|nr:truncated transposase [Escherichia coli]